MNAGFLRIPRLRIAMPRLLPHTLREVLCLGVASKMTVSHILQSRYLGWLVQMATSWGDHLLCNTYTGEFVLVNVQSSTTFHSSVQYVLLVRVSRPKAWHAPPRYVERMLR